MNRFPFLRKHLIILLIFDLPLLWFLMFITQWMHSTFACKSSILCRRRNNGCRSIASRKCQRVSVVSGRYDRRANEKQSNHFKKDWSSKSASTLKCCGRSGFPYFVASQYSKQDPLICGKQIRLYSGFVDQVLQPICL